MSATSQFRFNDGERNIDTVIISQTSQPQPKLAPVNYSSFDPFSLLFAIIPVLVVGVFVAILGLFAYTIIQGISTAAYNNQQPIVSRDAKVVSKRQNVSGGANTSTSTSYYVTFEFAAGNREEFHITGNEYGLISEGDQGILQSQGTRYRGFQRQI